MGPSKDSAPSFIEALILHGRISRGMASFSLGNNGPSLNQESYMTFGGINYDQFVGDLHKFKIVNDKWWSVSYQGLMYDNKVIDYFDHDQAVGVVDTGTSMMAMPTPYYERLVQAWQAQIDDPALLDCSMGLCIGGQSCEKLEGKLSNLTMQIGDLYFDMMPNGFLINATDLGAEPAFENKCIFGVIPLPDVVADARMFLLGDVFLRNFYSVFDYDEQEVYLAINSHAKDRVGISHTRHSMSYLVGAHIFFYLITGLLFARQYGR